VVFDHVQQLPQGATRITSYGFLADEISQVLAQQLVYAQPFAWALD
jgi:hypothetical protein